MSRVRTIYDITSRTLVRRDAQLMLAWLLKIELSSLEFVRFLNAHLGTRETGERVADMVALVTDQASHGMPWVLVGEIQTAPDHMMRGRLLELMGSTLRLERIEEYSQADLSIAGLVVNLTGNGNSFKNSTWPNVGITTSLPGIEVNLCERDAAKELEAVAEGRAPSPVLTWQPLFQNGNTEGNIKRWSEVAAGVRYSLHRAELTHVLTFAELVGTRELWEQTVRRSNVLFRESQVVNAAVDELVEERLAALRKEMRQDMQQAIKKEMQQALPAAVQQALPAAVQQAFPSALTEEVVDLLKDRWQDNLADLTPALRQINDLATVRHNLRAAARCSSPEEFRRTVRL